MVGIQKRPEFKGKAAETKGLVLFCQELLQKHIDKFGPVDKRKAMFLMKAGEANSEFDRLLNAGDTVLSRQEIQAIFFQYLRFASFMERAGVGAMPKTHWMLHLIQQAIFKGNPKDYTTYRDESLNGR